MQDKKKEQQIPGVFYFYVHSRLWEMVRGEEVSRKELAGLLFEWRIPKQFRDAILKELDILGLIKIESRRRVRIFRPKYDDESLHLILHDLMLPKEAEEINDIRRLK